MKSIVVVTAAALALALDVSQPARADTKGEILNDEDHRYRLEITLAQKSAVGGEDMPTVFCLSPTSENKVEVCLGEQHGHSFFVGNGSIFVYGPIRLGDLDNHGNLGNPTCRCERPVVLRAEQPLCWSISVLVPNFPLPNGTVAGFVNILEDVHEIGGTAESCVNVDSNRVPLTIKVKKDDTSQPPKGSSPRLRS